jgi:hypothetical protein
MPVHFILYEDGDAACEDSSDIIQLVTEDGKIDVAAMMDDLPPGVRRRVAQIIVNRLNEFGFDDGVLKG